MPDLSALYDKAASYEDFVAAYQRIIDSGEAWLLEGHVGRTAMSLIESGDCILGEEGHRDYWGAYVPSRHEVKPGTIGSVEYAERMKEV